MDEPKKALRDAIAAAIRKRGDERHINVHGGVYEVFQDEVEPLADEILTLVWPSDKVALIDAEELRQLRQKLHDYGSDATALRMMKQLPEVHALELFHKLREPKAKRTLHLGATPEDE